MVRNHDNMDAQPITTRPRMPKFMRNIAVSNVQLCETQHAVERDIICIDDISIVCSMLLAKSPAFNPADPKHRHSVLVKTRAFSCNYRDKTLFLVALHKHQDEKRSYYVIGSEFVADVVSVGRDVSNVQVGDRVMGDNYYVGIAHHALNPYQQGVPTNHASREYQILPCDKLMLVPPAMPDALAAGFSIAAQTAYGMVAKVEPIFTNATCLVVAAKSNTSLAVIRRLHQEKVRIFAISTSAQAASRLYALGAEEVFIIDPKRNYFTQHLHLREVAQQVGLFDYVFDPFFDLHIEKALPLVKPYGKYVTCGLYKQHGLGTQAVNTSQEFANLMNWAILNNISLIGNCLGATQHLQQALADYQTGRFALPIDSTFRGSQARAFLDRTYNAKERFGKVVYQYD